MGLLIKPSRLHAAIAAVCPIVGVQIGTIGVAASVKIDFAAAATGQQRTAAQSVVTAFDWSDAADIADRDAVESDLSTMRDQAQAAFDANVTYLAIASPTNAQVLAQTRALTQQNQKIIKALARLIARTL